MWVRVEVTHFPKDLTAFEALYFCNHVAKTQKISKEKMREEKGGSEKEKKEGNREGMSGDQPFLKALNYT